MQMVLQQDWENTKWMKVNLSVPKFDANSTINLKDGPLLFFFFFLPQIFNQSAEISVYMRKFSSVQSFSHIQLFATPWTAARQASLSITNSWSLLKLMSI